MKKERTPPPRPRCWDETEEAIAFALKDSPHTLLFRSCLSAADGMQLIFKVRMKPEAVEELVKWWKAQSKYLKSITPRKPAK